MSGAERGGEVSGETLNPLGIIVGRLIAADLATEAAADIVARHRRLLAECLPHLRSADARPLRARVVAELERAARGEAGKDKGE